MHLAVMKAQMYASAGDTVANSNPPFHISAHCGIGFCSGSHRVAMKLGMMVLQDIVLRVVLQITEHLIPKIATGVEMFCPTAQGAKVPPPLTYKICHQSMVSIKFGPMPL